jgi:hypothetical protein
MVEYLTRIEPDWKIFRVEEAEKGLEVYKNNQIDCIIVDFATEENNSLIEDILNTNPKQKMIIVSEYLSCREEKKCVDCVSLYNKRRLLKPLDPKELYYAIKNFDIIKCKYFNLECFENIRGILPDIMKRFIFYTYDQDRKVIALKKEEMAGKEHGYMGELIDILDILNQHDVKYNMLNETDVKIL